MTSSFVDPARAARLTVEQARATLAITDEAQLAVHRELPRWLSLRPTLAGFTLLYCYALADSGGHPGPHRHVMLVVALVGLAGSYVVELMLDRARQHPGIKAEARPPRTGGSALEVRLTLAVIYGGSVAVAVGAGWWWLGFPASLLLLGVSFVLNRRWHAAYAQLGGWGLSREQAAAVLGAAGPLDDSSSLVDAASVDVARPASDAHAPSAALSVLAALEVTIRIHETTLPQILALPAEDAAAAVETLIANRLAERTKGGTWLRATRQGRTAFRAHIHRAELAAGRSGSTAA